MRLTALRKGPAERMRFGISHASFHDQRLDRDHLAQIAACGFDAIEFFATRSHFDYHDEAAIATLARVAGGNGADAGSVHAPIAERRHERPVARRRLSNARRDDAARQAAVRETEAALQMARRIPFEHAGRAPRHARRPQAARATTTAPRRCAAPKRFAALAEPLGVRVAFEVIPNELSTPASLVSTARTGSRRAAAGICLDFGHAHLMGDVADAIETAAEHVIATHVHDNRGREDDHLVPFARHDQLGHGADDDAEDRLRRDVPDGAREHRRHRRAVLERARSRARQRFETRHWHIHDCLHRGHRARTTARRSRSRAGCTTAGRAARSTS